MYDKERNIVLSAKVDNVDDIIVTTVDDNGNTLVSVIDDDVDSVSIINLADDSISLELVDCSDGDVPDVLPSWSSSRSRCRLSHTKRYQPSSPKLLKPHTNKHKSYCSFVSTYDALDDDDETVPGLSNRFHTPCSFPLTSSSAVLLPSQYDSVLQDDVNGELYFDALEDIDPDLSKHLGHYVNIGDFTFSNDNPLSVFWDPDQGSSDLHGERIYRHMLGADICVFVTKSEDDGLHPYDHTFWVKCFHRANISHHIYQSVLDYAAQVSIESLEVHDILEPSSPRITTPTKIDHKVMWPFFAWMPVEHICKTFEHTTQFMRILLSTYLWKCHRSANPAANIFCQAEADATDITFSDTPAVGGGQTVVQFFAGCHTKLASVHPLKDTSEEKILGAFQDHVWWYRAPDELTADNASVYNGIKFLKCVCDLYIQFW